jgi:DNA-binding transcriptional ArsR family regulator
MSKLSPAKRRAILALVEHGSVAQAADACNLSRQTLYRWLREPAFTRELREASGSQVEQASRRLDSLLLRAIDELERLLSSESEQQRRLAVDSILSHGVRLRELTQLEQRVRALEDRAGSV